MESVKFYAAFTTFNHSKGTKFWKIAFLNQ